MPELRHIHQIVKLVNVETSQCKEVDNLSERCQSECTMLLSSLPGIDRREGTSQIVKCVGVETPHCGDVVDPHCQDVEMWWIHILSVAVHI